MARINFLISNQNLSTSIANTNGHINQERQKLKPTKSLSATIQIRDEGNNDALFLLSDAPNIKWHGAAYTIVEFTPKYRAYMDYTGNFPYTSSRGNQYILVWYHFDGNAILAEPFKKQQDGEITKAWNKLNMVLNYSGM